MKEDYLTDEEYGTYFPKLSSLRSMMAKKLPIEKGMCILDLATGYGYFAIELASIEGDTRLVGIDISGSDVNTARENIKKRGLSHRIEVLRMDATKMEFKNGEFDLVANFLGLEDIHMTRGRLGVEKAFSEAFRILKRGSHFCFAAMPRDQVETEAQMTEVTVFSRICGATWLLSAEYEEMLEKNGFELKTKRVYRTGKKLTPEQAKSEIRFACENAPGIYGVRTPSFEEVWAEFGDSIERNGMGHYSRVMLFMAQKPDSKRLRSD